ncbi:MAG: chorismate-binding protein [Chloracidobacterium sp.]|uniref:Anthranilate synthase component 1 n=1 Tax=Chloracidobacterium validum TaxID=2821543 RepID=A0ABX8BDG2_9BACT|nr:chorismate-binding protein [Chloracidobacterium validum]QUW03575.1 chorismate-binding protein [Chloracidobacterium validum]
MSAMQFNPATYDAFLRLAQEATVVPVALSLPADIHTPVGVFLKLAGDATDACLFENHRLDRRLPPYTFLGLSPRWVVTGKDGKVELRTSHATLERPETLLQAARRRLRADIPARLANVPELVSGAFGYLAHELAYQLYDGPRRTPPTVEGILASFGTVVVFNHLRQQLQLVVNVATDGRTERLESEYEQACDRLRTLRQQLDGSFPEPPPTTSSGTRAIVSPLTPEQFRRAAEHVEQQITAGRLDSVTLAQRLERPFRAAPFAAYRLLRMSPEPLGTFFFRSGNLTLLGGAANNLVRGEDDTLRAYVATHERPASNTEFEMSLAAAELADDEVAANQHLLFVDATRNDLGQVAGYGSLDLETLSSVEQTPTHLRLVSTLHAKLAPGRDYLDVLAARLPSSLWTGLPKASALRVTTEVEPVRRHHFGSHFCLLAPQIELLACETCQVIEITGQVARFHAFVNLTGDTNLGDALIRGTRPAQYLAAILEQAEAESAQPHHPTSPSATS